MSFAALSLVIKVIFALVLTIKRAQACENLMQQEVNGCDFDPLEIMVESTGFIITSENCGLMIPKENFIMKPHVFYAKAEENQKYTLIMIEESGESSADERRNLQWLVTDIPVCFIICN